MAEPNLPRCGNWQAVKELGHGGQGVVFSAVNSEQASRWETNFTDIFPKLARETQWSYSERRKLISDFFHLLEARLQGKWTAQGALKILHISDPKESTKANKRLQTEIEALKKIEHPNIVRILDHGKDASWLVYELFTNGTLDGDIARFKGSPERAVAAMTGLVDAVATLHDKKLLHRDIKPTNIFYGNEGRLVLGDFGLVLEDGAERVTSTNEKVGTSDWMPTWCQGHMRWENVKPSFDVFAIGKLLWALIAGDRFLQLHYFKQDKFNLEKRFPNDSRMKLINEFLSKCVVEFENGCVPNARSLQPEFEKLSTALTALRVPEPPVLVTPVTIAKGPRNPKFRQEIICFKGKTTPVFNGELFITLHEVKQYGVIIGIEGPSLEPALRTLSSPGTKTECDPFEIRLLSVTDSYAKLFVMMFA